MYVYNASEFITCLLFHLPFEAYAPLLPPISDRMPELLRYTARLITYIIDTPNPPSKKHAVESGPATLKSSAQPLTLPFSILLASILCIHLYPLRLSTWYSSPQIINVTANIFKIQNINVQIPVDESSFLQYQQTLFMQCFHQSLLFPHRIFEGPLLHFIS